MDIWLILLLTVIFSAWLLFVIFLLILDRKNITARWRWAFRKSQKDGNFWKQKWMGHRRREKRFKFKSHLISLAKHCNEENIIVVSLFASKQAVYLDRGNRVVAAKLDINLLGFRASVYVVKRKGIKIDNRRLNVGNSRVLFTWYDDETLRLPRRLDSRKYRYEDGLCLVKV